MALESKQALKTGRIFLRLRRGGVRANSTQQRHPFPSPYVPRHRSYSRGSILTLFDLLFLRFPQTRQHTVRQSETAEIGAAAAEDRAEAKTETGAGEQNHPRQRPQVGLERQTGRTAAVRAKRASRLRRTLAVFARRKSRRHDYGTGTECSAFSLVYLSM